MASISNNCDDKDASSSERLRYDMKSVQGHANRQPNVQLHHDQEDSKPKTTDTAKEESDEVNLTEMANNMRLKSYAKPVIPYQSYRTSIYGRNLYSRIEENAVNKIIEQELNENDEVDLMMQRHRNTPNRKRIDLNTKVREKVKDATVDEPDPENLTEIANRMRLKSYAKPVIPLRSYSSPVSDNRALYELWKVKNEEEQVQNLAEELIRKQPMTPVVGEVGSDIKEKFLNIQAIIKQAEDEAKDQEVKCRAAEIVKTPPMQELEENNPPDQESSSPQLKKSFENVMEDPQFVLRDAYSRFLSVAVTCKMENVPSFDEWCEKLSSSSSQLKHEWFNLDICNELPYQDTDEGATEELDTPVARSASLSNCPQPPSVSYDNFRTAEEYSERRRQRRIEFDNLFNQVSFVARSSLPSVWRMISLLKLESSEKH